MSNERKTVLYTGVTSDLTKRAFEHKSKVIPNSFTSKYNINKLVYYESFDDPSSAITREKQIKSGSRNKKILLIEGINKEWRDLSEDF